MPACPLCRARTVSLLTVVGGLQYFKCARCRVRFLAPDHFPSPEAEQAHYEHHENRVDDPGYRRFLSRLAGPLLAKLAPRSYGLDYGCGPGPALSAMLEEAGHEMALYDPFFAPDTGVLEGEYDFVTCTETAEHFHDPAAEFSRLMGLVKPGGWLGIMTCFQTEDSRFAAWHYRMDPTHVVFYREASFRYISAVAGWRCHIPRKDVVLMQKP